jgi:hypothetical protein
MYIQIGFEYLTVLTSSLLFKYTYKLVRNRAISDSDIIRTIAYIGLEGALYIIEYIFILQYIPRTYEHLNGTIICFFAVIIMPAECEEMTGLG